MSFRRTSSPQLPHELRRAVRCFHDCPSTRSPFFPRAVSRHHPRFFSAPSLFTPFDAFGSFFAPIAPRRGRDPSGWPHPAAFFPFDLIPSPGEHPEGRTQAGSTAFEPWTPAVEVQNLADRYVVQVQVPGAKKEDLKLEFVPSQHGRRDDAPVLVVSGKVEREHGQRPQVEGGNQTPTASIGTKDNNPPSQAESGATTPKPAEPAASTSAATEAGAPSEASANTSETEPLLKEGAPKSSIEQEQHQQGWGFFQGSFTRSLQFPSAIDVEAVQAKYENGVLRVEVPKREPDQPAKTIPIQ